MMHRSPDREPFPAGSPAPPGHLIAPLAPWEGGHRSAHLTDLRTGVAERMDALGTAAQRPSPVPLCRDDSLYCGGSGVHSEETEAWGGGVAPSSDPHEAPRAACTLRLFEPWLRTVPTAHPPGQAAQSWPSTLPANVWGQRPPAPRPWLSKGQEGALSELPPGQTPQWGTPGFLCCTAAPPRKQEPASLSGHDPMTGPRPPGKLPGHQPCVPSPGRGELPPGCGSRVPVSHPREFGPGPAGRGGNCSRWRQKERPAEGSWLLPSGFQGCFQANQEVELAPHPRGAPTAGPREGGQALPHQERETKSCFT